MFDAIADGIAERLKQTRGGQNGDVVGLKTKEPSRFKHVQPSRENLAAQEFILSFQYVHAEILCKKRKPGMYQIHKEANPPNA